jgi:hypothetical protein
VTRNLLILTPLGASARSIDASTTLPGAVGRLLVDAHFLGCVSVLARSVRS